MPCRKDNRTEDPLYSPTLAELEDLEFPGSRQHSHGWHHPFRFRGFDDGFGRQARRDTAYPVPSEKQYERCIAEEGKPGWTREGVWKCLMKNRQPVQGGTSEELFPDYTGFLEFRRLARQAEREQRQEKHLARGLTSSTSSAPKLRMIPESEAKGKNMVGETVTSSSFWNSNGQHETKRRVIRVFDDNTATESSTSEISQGASAKQDNSNGWFWK